MSTGDANLDLRIRDLIDRGLELYGGGDLEGAMNAWRHALALDDTNQRAADYVAYVKRHFAMIDEHSHETVFTSSDAELEIPFGVESMEPINEAGVDAYDLLVVGDECPANEVSMIAEFEEEVPTRVRPAYLDLDVDEGWLLELDDDDADREGTNPRIEVPADRAQSDPELALIEMLDSVDEGLALLAEESAENLEVELEIATDFPTSQIAVPPPLDSALELDLGKGGGGIGVIGGEPIGPTRGVDLDLDLGDSGGALRTADGARRTIAGRPDGPLPGDVHQRVTAEINPFELGDALDALEAEETPPGSVSLADVEFDLTGAGSRPIQLDGADEYADISVEPAVGDAAISFHRSDDPIGAIEDLDALGLGDLDAISMEPHTGPVGTDVELQLAELEHEMKTGSRDVEWTTHDSSGGGEPAPILPDRAGKPSSPPVSGVEALAAQILADVDHAVDANASAEQRMLNRIGLLIDYARRETEKDEHSAAAVAADLALSESPNSAAAQKLIHEKSDLLMAVFRRHLGDLEGIPAVALPLHELALHELDHRTAFLLSRVDGDLSLEDILDVSGMPRLEAFRYLARLVLRGILEIR